MSDKKTRGFLAQACMQTAAGGSAGMLIYLIFKNISPNLHNVQDLLKFV